MLTFRSARSGQDWRSHRGGKRAEIKIYWNMLIFFFRRINRFSIQLYSTQLDLNRLASIETLSRAISWQTNARGLS